MARRELWQRAHESGVKCGAEHGEGRWYVTCDLPPGHELPHEAWRGYGSVVYQQWPWLPRTPVPDHWLERRYDRMTEHRPGRPHWHCTTCGQTWPCGTAKSDLRKAATNGKPEEVRRALQAASQDAERDFEILGILPEQGDLYDRFVAWLRTK